MSEQQPSPGADGQVNLAAAQHAARAAMRATELRITQNWINGGGVAAAGMIVVGSVAPAFEQLVGMAVTATVTTGAIMIRRAPRLRGILTSAATSALCYFAYGVVTGAL